MAGDTFWEVLSGRIRDGAQAGESAPRRSWPVTQTWDPGLRFVLLGGALRPHPAPSHTADLKVRPTPADTEARPCPADDPVARPFRRLTAIERAALDVLRASGASDLDEGFTAVGLRRAYRRLALRWHPDRHAQASPSERANLARTFARIADAYRLLAGDLRQAA